MPGMPADENDEPANLDVAGNIHSNGAFRVSSSAQDLIFAGFEINSAVAVANYDHRCRLMIQELSFQLELQLVELLNVRVYFDGSLSNELLGASFTAKGDLGIDGTGESSICLRAEQHPCFPFWNQSQSAWRLEIANAGFERSSYEQELEHNWKSATIRSGLTGRFWMYPACPQTKMMNPPSWLCLPVTSNSPLHDLAGCETPPHHGPDLPVRSLILKSTHRLRSAVTIPRRLAGAGHFDAGKISKHPVQLDEVNCDGTRPQRTARCELYLQGQDVATDGSQANSRNTRWGRELMTRYHFEGMIVRGCFVRQAVNTDA